MKVRSYNPTTFAILDPDVTGISFGTVVQGNHCSAPVVVQPYGEAESTFTLMALFLENRDSFPNCTFGKYSSLDQIPSITPGSNYLSDHFVVHNDISDISVFSDDGILFSSITPSAMDYVWLDTQVGASQTPVDDTINYRFVFEYV